MNAASQTHRQVAVSSSLGPDVLLFREMVGQESLGQPFQYRLHLYSELDDIDLNGLLGQPMVVRLALPEGEKPRFFHGMVSDAEFMDADGRYFHYEVTLRPWLWFLSYRVNHRIFQHKTVIEIAQMLFEEHGFGDLELRLTEEYQPREYCVQYRESDLDFVSRLFEEEGIYFFFEHHSDKHILVVADGLSAHEKFPGYEHIPYFPLAETNRRERDHVDRWVVRQQVQPGEFSQRDYDFRVPGKNLQTARQFPREHARASYEVFNYPGRYLDRGRGSNLSKVRIEERQWQHQLVQGGGPVRGFTSGALFDLEAHPHKRQNGEYLLVSVKHRIHSDDYESQEKSGELAEIYRCQFTAIPSEQPFRTPSQTPRPVVQGPQTAVVVGPPGEEIHTDRYGQVKVQFHWDRYGEYNENSSCWVRVSQPWAGKGWGGMNIPRIGQEVVVEFLEGDPDQPIITGRVYNGTNMPPFKLPEQKVVSGMKSNTHKGSGYNEIAFDDTAGNELLRTHAQYDRDTTVGNDQRLKVGKNRTDDIGVNHTETVGNNRSAQIGVNDTEIVGSNKTVDVGDNLMLRAGNSITLNCGASTIRMNAGGVITISGVLVNILGVANCNMLAPITTVTGSAVLATQGPLNLSTGGYTRIQGGVTEIIGGPIKLNP